MSTRAYSKDLREKVIKSIESGKTQVEASKVFSLNISTVNRWYKRYRKEGHCDARKNLGAKSRIDNALLEQHISNNPNIRLKDLAVEFGMAVSSMHYCLKRLGYSYKKKRSPMWNLVKKGVLNI